MKEDRLSQNAKKIRNKLIYFIHLELKKKASNNNHLLINSMTTNELNNEYKKYYNYCMKQSETYRSNQANNNNSYYVSVTCNIFNNNIHMLIDDININKILGDNNIIGKYYKGNDIKPKMNSNIREHNHVKKIDDNNLEKMIIGNKKFNKKRKSICSSLEFAKNILINDNDNETNDYLNLNSNYNNYKQTLITNTNNDNKKNGNNSENKIKKSKHNKIVNIYTLKLKNYCATLKRIKKNKINNLRQSKNAKQLALLSPSLNDRKKLFKKEREMTMKSEKDKPKLHELLLATKYHKEISIVSQNKIPLHNFNLRNKSPVKKSRNHNPLKNQEKKINRKNKTRSIDSSPIKIISQKRISPKKICSPRKTNNQLKISNDKKFNGFKYSNKTRKSIEVGVKKYISGGISSKRGMFNNQNQNQNQNQIANNRYNPNSGITFLNNVKPNPTVNKRPLKQKLKRANTGINPVYNMKFHEMKVKKTIFEE